MTASACLISFFSAALLSCFLSSAVRDSAVRRGWVQVPDLDRHVHSKPIPRLGGIAIYLSLFTIVLTGLFFPELLGIRQAAAIRPALSILTPAAVIFFVGLYDDLRTASAYFKFGMQTLAAVLLYWGGYGVQRFDLFSHQNRLPQAVGLPLTVFWVLLITNAFNLIDGLDGLAAGSALFSTFAVFILSLLGSSPLVSFISIVLAGAILGFLRHNFHPASIFLGDSGSLFIGFLLSALALAGSQKAPTAIAVAIPVVCLGFPILDVVIAVVRRFLAGKPLFGADKEHIHHKLLKRGLSQRAAVLILYAVSAVFALLSMTLLHGSRMLAVVLVILGVGVGLGIRHLRYHEFAELRRVLQRTVSQKRIITNDLHIRRAKEFLTSCADAGELCQILIDTLRPLEFDAFTLRLPADARLLRSVPPSLIAAPDAVHWRWLLTEHAGPAWELKLELTSSSGKKCGFFSLYHRSAAKPLLMDISLLVDGFREVLADAVERSVIQTRDTPRDEQEIEHPHAPVLARSSRNASDSRFAKTMGVADSIRSRG